MNSPVAISSQADLSSQAATSNGAAVALFGTSADPPSLGHRALLEGLLAHYPRVVTWASSNPFKQHGAPLELRAALLQALVEQLANPRLRLEQRLSSPRTIETLDRARALWPEAELVVVVGSDLVSQIPRWYRAEQWLGQCRLAVVPRQGWALQQADLGRLRQLGARVEVLPLTIPASASSQIRHHPSPELVPAALWPALVKHNLYGAANQGTPPPGPQGARGQPDGGGTRQPMADSEGAAALDPGTLALPAAATTRPDSGPDRPPGGAAQGSGEPPLRPRAVSPNRPRSGSESQHLAPAAALAPVQAPLGSPLAPPLQSAVVPSPSPHPLPQS